MAEFTPKSSFLLDGFGGAGEESFRFYNANADGFSLLSSEWIG